MTVTDDISDWEPGCEDAERIIAALVELDEQDANDPDGHAGPIIQKMTVSMEALHPGDYLPQVADLFKRSRGAFKPHVGGLDDLAIVDGMVFVKADGQWESSGERALEALLADWCPQGCEPVGELYEFTASVQPTLFAAFALMVSKDLADKMGMTGCHMTPLGEYEVRSLGRALAAVAGHGLELVEAYTEALLVLDGTLWKCRHRSFA